MVIGAELLEVGSVEPQDMYHLLVTFSTGKKKIVDLSLLLQNPPPVFVRLQDAEEFRKVSVNAVGGVEWACGADLSADYLLAAPGF